MGISQHDRQIQLLVKDVEDGYLRLPELQRQYVWKSTQVRDFFDSLYRDYPTGQLLVWETDDMPHARDLSAQGIGASYRRPQLLLDGQQRLTSLYAVMTGKAIEVRDRTKHIAIVFNVLSERFEVETAATRPQSGWVSLTRLFMSNPIDLLDELGMPLNDPASREALKNMNRVGSIKDYRYRVTALENIPYDEVTDIFVRINSGGTRLSNADLSLAQISSRWHGVSKELDDFRHKAKSLGWELDYSILLRVLSAIATNQATLSQLFKAGRGEDLTTEKLQEAWQRAKPAMVQAIHFIKQNCVIDRLDMLPTNYVLVPLTVFFDRFRQVSQQQERDLQRWLYTALIWARYSGSSETNLDQDIKAIGDDEPVRRMIQNIEDKIGPGRRVTERELESELSNSPYMVMAYVLARRNQAQDWFNGVAIGDRQELEYHHIFPKALLGQRFKERSQSRIINQVANLAFLSQRANARIAASAPVDYLSKIEPNRLREQAVPLEPQLWSLDRYEDFVRERRVLLADAINGLLSSLMAEPTQWVSDMTKQIDARLGTAEESLRGLINRRLSTNFGPRAWVRCVPEDIKESVRQRIEQRLKRNPFEEELYQTLAGKLTQCQFGDYGKIIKSNWALFEDVFSDKAAFDRQMVAVQEARNAIAHRRDMNQGEQHQAAGGLYWFEQCLRAAERDEEDEGDEQGDTTDDVMPAL